jgi:hypothetical protein
MPAAHERCRMHGRPASESLQRRCYGAGVGEDIASVDVDVNRWSSPMQKLNDLSRSLTPLKPDGTLIAVIEMSLSSWLVAGIVPGVERQPLKKLEVDESTLLKLLAGKGITSRYLGTDLLSRLIGMAIDGGISRISSQSVSDRRRLKIGRCLAIGKAISCPGRTTATSRPWSSVIRVT